MTSKTPKNEITSWESKVVKLQDEFEEKLTEKMQIAILTGMMPASIQDYIYTTAGDDTSYRTMVDKVRSWVRNKVAMYGNGPAPMDIGEVEQEWCEAEWDDGDGEQDAVDGDDGFAGGF